MKSQLPPVPQSFKEGDQEEPFKLPVGQLWLRHTGDKAPGHIKCMCQTGTNDNPHSPLCGYLVQVVISCHKWL